MQSVYLDYNATTTLDPAVRTVMFEVFESVRGNPSSLHRYGRAARVRLDEAREGLAELWGSKPSEVVFTSGGTESNNLAILGAGRACRERGRHLIASAVEHHAVLNACRSLVEHNGFEFTAVPVDRFGRVNVEQVSRLIRPETILVSVMAANNEVGTLQPVAEIGALCRERGVLFHTDAVQWFGKESFTGMGQFHADLVSLCAHKFHGPTGAGALYVRSPLKLEPMLRGGGQEHERRAGTENLPAIVGLVEAFARFVPTPVFDARRLRPLRDELLDALRIIEGVRVHTPAEGTLSNTATLSAQGCDSLSLLAGMDLEGFCVSSGAACSVGALEPSHVLRAMGVSPEEASAMVRFSLGRETSADDTRQAARALTEVIQRIRCHQSHQQGVDNL